MAGKVDGDMTTSAGVESKQRILFQLPGMQEYNGHFFLPFEPPWLLEEVKSLDMYDGDILFGTYPRSGTPFLSEILWLMYNDVNLEQARSTHQGARVRFMEHLLAVGNPLDKIRLQKPPRLLKTHLDASFFRTNIRDTKVKVVVMLREPKDVLVSLYKFYKADPGYVKFPGTWDDFFDIFRAKQLLGGDWFAHTRTWLDLKDLDNVLILGYEEIHNNPMEQIRKIADFCRKDLSDDDVGKIAHYVTTEVAMETPIGGWKDYFTDEQLAYFKKIYKQEIGV